MGRKLICIVTILCFCVFNAVPAFADARDDEIKELKTLVQQLMKRIEKLEQQQVEVKEEAKEEAVKEAKKVAKKVSGLPKWVQNTKFKGDVRVRNEQIWKEPGTNQSRQRIRFRYGFETKVTDKVKAGARLVSGGQGVTSTNQTLDDAFEHPDISFDLAYVKFSPYDWIRLDGGIFKNPYYRTDDLIWDSDVTFQGAAGKLQTDLDFIGLEDTDVFAVFGGYPLEETSGSSHDPWLMAGQGGFKSKIMENVKLAACVAYYDFVQTQGAVLANRENDNTNLVNGAFANDYNVIAVNGELEFKDIFSLGAWETPLAFNCNNIPIAVIGDFVHNTAVDSDENGWLVGARIGPKKVKKKGQWRAYYNYRVLEKDAFVDIFPDGDPQSGGTNLRSNEIIFDYGLLDNVILGLDYYRTKEDSGTDNDQDILQADVVVKF